jgi:hypothetical protein
MKKVDKSSSAGAKVDSSTNVEDSQVCQPIAKHHVMRCDIIEQLRKLGCNKLVLGEYKAIVGQFGFVINYVSKDGIKHEIRWKENDEINITEIIDDNYFLSGDLIPSFSAHKHFFKGIVRRSA